MGETTFLDPFKRGLGPRNRRNNISPIYRPFLIDSEFFFRKNLKVHPKSKVERLEGGVYVTEVIMSKAVITFSELSAADAKRGMRSLPAPVPSLPSLA